MNLGVKVAQATLKLKPLWERFVQKFEKDVLTNALTTGVAATFGLKACTILGEYFRDIRLFP